MGKGEAESKVCEAEAVKDVQPAQHFEAILGRRLREKLNEIKEAVSRPRFLHPRPLLARLRRSSAL